MYFNPDLKTYQIKGRELTSLSSSSRVNSFFLTTFSWLRKLNSAAFFWSLANLFSYLDTFLSVGLTLEVTKYVSKDVLWDYLSGPISKNVTRNSYLVQIMPHFQVQFLTGPTVMLLLLLAYHQITIWDCIFLGNTICSGIIIY